MIIWLRVHLFLWALVVTGPMLGLMAPAQAWARFPDKVKSPAGVMLKTGLVGAAGGAILGVGAVTAFGSSAKTFGQFTAAGMYAGLLVGLFVLLAPADLFYDSADESEENPKQGQLRTLDSAAFEENGVTPDIVLVKRVNAPMVLNEVAIWSPLLSFRF